MMPIKNPFRCFTLFLVPAWMLYSSFIMTTPVFGQQDTAVLMAPTRVVFEGRTRATTVKLINPNKTPQTYQISLISIRMDEYGARTEALEPNEAELFARSMVQFSPKRATLAPQGWQTVRVMVRKPADLPEGEYRAQLKVSPVPGEKAPDSRENTEKIAINIDIVFHVSIPIIIRHGKVDAAVAPLAPRLITRDQGHFLETRIERSGAASVFADVKAFFTPLDRPGQRIPVGEVKGISIYAQNPDQTIYLPVKDKNVLTRGKVDIEITNREKKDEPVMALKSFDFN
ncbi:MAG: fimbria/pilus periplasmic chaperone [Desulfobacteraceae bacterium]|nr:fimbria/pilus periplasmic chaperone [Desulfobacteraceae bacterium]